MQNPKCKKLHRHRMKCFNILRDLKNPTLHYHIDLTELEGFSSDTVKPFKKNGEHLSNKAQKALFALNAHMNNSIC